MRRIWTVLLCSVLLATGCTYAAVGGKEDDAQPQRPEDVPARSNAAHHRRKKRGKTENHHFDGITNLI